MSDLDISEDVFVPELSLLENPEQLLTVEDSEVGSIYFEYYYFNLLYEAEFMFSSFICTVFDCLSTSIIICQLSDIKSHGSR